MERWRPLVGAAANLGFEALEVTIDTAVPGRRGRDLKNGFGVAEVDAEQACQLDAAVSTIAMLPECVSAAGGRLSVLIDSGFRTGSDILKALVLRAQAVQLGRSTLFGLAAGGEAGVSRALAILAIELDVAMALTGIDTFAKAPRLGLRSAG